MATWYEVTPERLVLEYIRVRKKYSNAVLKKSGTSLGWVIEIDPPPFGNPVPLRVEIIYTEAFPAQPPNAKILSPDLPKDFGHTWHRWFGNGNICYVKPRFWAMSSTADEIIEKLHDWYFNFVAKSAGLVDKMPDVGRWEQGLKSCE